MAKQLFEPISLDHTGIFFNERSISDAPINEFYHWHQCCELLFIHEGQGTVLIQQQTIPIQRGMLFFFQPHELHRVHAHISPGHPYVRTVIHFNSMSFEKEMTTFPRRSKLLRDISKAPEVQRSFQFQSNYDQLCDIFTAYEQRAAPRQSEDTLFLLLQLLTMIEQHTNLHLTHNYRSTRYSEEIIQWLEQHFQDSFNLDLLAEELHLSKTYVSRIFKKETSSTITEYLLARRIKEACFLLKTTDAPVDYIAQQVGLFNTSHFIQAFKKATGLTPLAFRKKQL